MFTFQIVQSKQTVYTRQGIHFVWIKRIYTLYESREYTLCMNHGTKSDHLISLKMYCNTQVLIFLHILYFRYEISANKHNIMMSFLVAQIPYLKYNFSIN